MLFLSALILFYCLIWFSARFNNHLQKFTNRDYLRFAFGISSISIGTLYILFPSLFEHFFASIFSSTYEVISIAGFVQIICGVGLLIRRVYREAAIFLIVLLTLFIPLSLIMIMDYVPGPLGADYEPILGYIRIIVYPLLVWILIKACELSPRKNLYDHRFDKDIGAN